MPRSAKQTNSPPPKSSIPAPAPKSSIPAPSMMDTMKQGFSFGIGSSIAHNIMNSIFRPAPKESMHDLYNKCIEKNDSTINCNVYLEKA